LTPAGTWTSSTMLAQQAAFAHAASTRDFQ
jgi:hypothetical protein